MNDASARHDFVKLHTSDVINKFMDGINLDFEDAVEANSAESIGYTALVRELSDTLHAYMPQGQVRIATKYYILYFWYFLYFTMTYLRTYN